ncbi:MULTISPECIES: ABC transporter permease [Inquilinus]|jgi:peptide/nickel transport system permease protein|uniref:Peptide/nickel transport system permease protein n=1 Tax=Inquilinus ginsengisoli TaxID=363840 RepID=A0ABU1K077_9PROT|nr:ABC transporter permease [Inquilinus ginsengisoli]MDR6293179.1 peptide/nickel transport system permease protein [Inquilinus ginsengisoli]
MTIAALSPSAEPVFQRPGRVVLVLRYLRRNKGLALGVLILLGLIAFTIVGLLTINPKDAYPLSVAVKKPPSLKYPFGTDFFGRDLFSAMVVGMWQTALIGFIAGGLGTLIGVVLGFIAAYFRGWSDAVIRTVCQILTPIPVLLIQVVIAGSLDKRDVTILTMALIVVLLAWMGPTLVIRSQVLTMKERQFVAVAKLSGVSDLGIIFKEILPCLLPFIAAAFVAQVFSAVFAAFYLAVLGLGPLREPLLGNIIWAAQSQGAFFNGWWWWPIIPSVAMILILGSLALINMGLDELANPRVRRTE